jgi:hypothetical protein
MKYFAEREAGLYISMTAVFIELISVEGLSKSLRIFIESYHFVGIHPCNRSAVEDVFRNVR